MYTNVFNILLSKEIIYSYKKIVYSYLQKITIIGKEKP